MTYTDNYGTWKVLDEISLSQNSSFIPVSPTPKKIIRYSYLIDWEEWNSNISVRSKCLVRWHYGLNKELVGFYSVLYPKSESNIFEYNLISPNSFLAPRELEIKLVPYNYKYYYININLLPWTIKVEEYQE